MENLVVAQELDCPLRCSGLTFGEYLRFCTWLGMGDVDLGLMPQLLQIGTQLLSGVVEGLTTDLMIAIEERSLYDQHVQSIMLIQRRP